MIQIAAILLVLEQAIINYLLSMVDILPQTHIAERICKQCVMNAVEDESHFYWSVQSMLIIKLRSLII